MKSFLVAFTLPSGLAYGACQTDAIVYNRSTGFGATLGGKGASSKFSSEGSINLPVFINGKAACFRKSDAVSFEAKTSKKENSASFLMSPVVAEFENVPEASVVQYFDFSHHGGVSSEIHLLTFICSGEIPLSKESYSDSIVGLQLHSNRLSMRAGSTFATGIAARNLQASRPVDRRGEWHFLKRFTELNHGISVESSPGNVYVPTVMASFQADVRGGVERSLYSSFQSRFKNSLNGCAHDMRSLLSDHLLENVLSRGGMNGIEMKKKKSQIEITIAL